MSDHSRPRGRRRRATQFTRRHYVGSSSESVPDNTVRREALVVWKSSFRRAIEDATVVHWPNPQTYHEVARDALSALLNEYREAGQTDDANKAASLLKQLDRLFHFKEAGDSGEPLRRGDQSE